MHELLLLLKKKEPHLQTGALNYWLYFLNIYNTNIKYKIQYNLRHILSSSQPKFENEHRNLHNAVEQSDKQAEIIILWILRQSICIS